ARHLDDDGNARHDTALSARRGGHCEDHAIGVGVAYGADPVQVKNLMQCAAKEHPDVMPTPEPMVVLDDLGDSALIFTLRYWIRIESGTDGRRVDSDLRCEILEKLNAAGIAVPYPQRDIRLSAVEPLPVAVVAPQERGS
ncbi:MAG: hypothetical protein EBV73_01490, partial [Rhodocyclales bacterium]|nr:hypothetical protein [Rhodocyclales bacterium]